MGKRIAVDILTVLGVVGILWLSLSLARAFYRQPQALGAQETVRLRAPSGEVELVAKIDTGADLSSLDAQLVRSLGYSVDSVQKRLIRTDRGVEERDVVDITYLLAGREVSSVATVADRTGFDTAMLVGKSDLTGFVVQPDRDFVSRPGQASGFQLIGPGDFAADNTLERVIMLVPILAAVVVVLRLLVGVRTYGLFAPTIIAITLLGQSTISGFVIYLFLIVVGMAIKVLLLDRLRLAHISELSVIMFLLALLIVGVTAASAGVVTFAGTFFPLIVTTHLVEQGSRSIEEHGLRDTFKQLASTLVAAVALTVIAAVLVQQSLAVLWVTLIVSVAASVAAGNYNGLRLSELVRFKFLRRTHVHS